MVLNDAVFENGEVERSREHGVQATYGALVMEADDWLLMFTYLRYTSSHILN